MEDLLFALFSILAYSIIGAIVAGLYFYFSEDMSIGDLEQNQGVACVYLQCQKKYEKYIAYQIQCLNTANREFLDLITKSQDKQEKNKRASNKKRSSL